MREREKRERKNKRGREIMRKYIRERKEGEGVRGGMRE